MPTTPFTQSVDIVWETVGAGVRRQVLGHLDDLMLVRVDFEAGAVGPVHHHPHRQASYVVAGRFEVTVGDDVAVLSVGDTFVAPSSVPHGVRALEAGTLLDSFTPARADFLAPR
jgi:quercetin dioxygenase-like cupin family protein